MIGVLFLVLLVVPIVEIYVMVQMAGAIGVVPTLAVLLSVSLAGAWLVKREGVGMLRRMQETLDRGELPTDQGVDGAVLLAAGTLLVVPGFVTDAVGLVLLLPPVRHLVRRRFVRLLCERLALLGVDAPACFGSGRVYDVQYVGDVTPPAYREPGTGPDADARTPLPELGPGRDA